MKLSEMPTKKAAAVMAELAVPVGALIKNPAVKEYLEKAISKKASLALLGDAIATLFPVLLQENYRETVKAIAIMTEKKPEEIDVQPMGQTVAEVMAFVDGDLIGFFTR